MTNDNPKCLPPTFTNTHRVALHLIKVTIIDPLFNQIILCAQFSFIFAHNAYSV
jgi:hypothetical protein